MDLDSWKPGDVYRRVSVAICVQIAVFAGIALVMALGWPWFVGWPLAIALGASLHLASMWLYERRRRSR